MKEVKYKPHTLIFAVCRAMEKAVITGGNVDISGMLNKHGDPVCRSSISAAINKAKAQYFKGKYFRTYRRRDGVLVLCEVKLS